jgi:hypothetical protein
MGRLRFLILVGTLLASISLGAAAHPSGAAPVQQDELARVRFVNASFDAPALDAYVDGRLWAGGIHDYTNYQSVPAGAHAFTFRLAGGGDDLAAMFTTVDAGQRVTVAAIYPVASMDMRLMIDDVSAPVRNAARVKVVHAAPDTGPLTVTAGDITLADGLKFGKISDAQQLYDDQYIVFAKGEDGLPVVGGVMVPVTGYHTYTLFVVGSAKADEFKLVTAVSTVLKPEPTSRFQFANMAQGVEELTAYVNNEAVPLFPNVPFSRVTEYYVTGYGPLRIDVYPAGSGPDDGTPLASNTMTIGPNENIIFIARGTAEALRIVAYSGDLSPLPVNTSRLQVIHVATGNPAIRITTLNDIALFDKIRLGGTASRIVPAGSYNLRFSDASTGDLMMEKNGFWLPSNTATTVIAFDDDPLTPLINAIAISVNNIAPVVPVRWAFLDSAAPPVDVYLDDQRLLPNMEYRDTADYLPLAPGRYTVTVYAAGADPTVDQPMTSATLDLRRADAPRTAYWFGTADDLRFETAPDNTTLIPADRARIRFINAITGSASVDIVKPVTGTRVLENLLFSESSVHLDLDAGTYAYVVMDGGEEIATLDDLDFKSGMSYTIALTGDVSNVQTLVLESTP